MSVPTHQAIWNRYVHISNAVSEHVDLARYVIEVDVTPENGAAFVRIRRAQRSHGQLFALSAAQAADYQACRLAAAAWAHELA